MKFVAWRIARALIFAAILAVVFRGCSAIPTQEGKHFDVEHAAVDVELQDDGSLLVTEALTFDFSGDFSGAFRDIPLNGDARITDVSVAERGEEYEPGASTGIGSFGFPETFGFEERLSGQDQTYDAEGRRGRDFRIVWHYRAADEERTFLITYRVINATDVRDDVVDVTWTVWGDQWEFWLDELETTISAESGAPPQAAWLRPRGLDADVEIEGDASASAERVGKHEAVGFRAVFPRDAIGSTAGTQARTGPGLPEIQAQEADLDDASGIWDITANFVAQNILALCLVIGGIAVGAAAIVYWRAREIPSEAPEYLPEPPEAIPPALAYAIATEGKYDDDVVLATLLDLVDRGYYQSRAGAGEDLDLELRKGAERPAAELAAYEVATLDFFDKLLDDEWIALGKMSDKIPKHSSTWRSRWENLNTALDQAEEGEIGWDRDLGSARTAIALAAGVSLLTVLVIYFIRTGHWVIPATAFFATQILIFALPASWTRRLEPAARERNARWHAFQKWTKDFPRLKDDPPATLNLWRRILVYAVAFGTAERVAKSGRIPAPVAEEASSQGIWIVGATHGDGFSGTGFAGFSSGFSSQVAAQSSSSGSGGFSGGGGGGFSGGGGGGAW